MNTKNILKILFLSFTLFSVSNISVANVVAEDEIKAEKELGVNDFQTSFMDNLTAGEKGSPVKKIAEPYNYNSDGSETQTAVLSIHALQNYFAKGLWIFIVFLIIAVVVLLVKTALAGKSIKDESKSYIFALVTHSITFFGFLGGFSYGLGYIALVFLISIIATASGWGWAIIETAVKQRYEVEIKHNYKLNEGDNAFSKILDIAIGEKRTLQGRVSNLHHTPELRDLSIKEYAEYFKEIEHYEVKKKETRSGFIYGYEFIAKTKKQPFYSFGKDKLNYPAVASTISFANNTDAESQDLNVDGYSRTSVVEKIVNAQSIDGYAEMTKIESTMKGKLDAGNSDYMSGDYTKNIDAVEKDMSQTINAFYSESGNDNKLVDDAEFLYNFAKGKYKGLDSKMTFLKFFKRGRDLSDFSLHLQCTQNSEAKRFTDENFNKFINSNKKVSEAVIDSKVNFECILPVNGEWVQFGYDETKDADKIKNAVNSLKAYKDAGTIYYKIVEAASSISMSNFIKDNYNAMDELREFKKIGQAGFLMSLKTISNAGYAAYKISRSNRESIIIDNSRLNNLFILEEAIFGMDEDDIFKTSEKDREYTLSHFNKMNTQSYYNSSVVLSKFSIDDMKIAEQVSYTDQANKIVDSMFSNVTLNIDSNAKYAMAFPQNLSIQDGLKFCNANPTNCDNIYKPSLFEVQYNVGREFVSTGMMCLTAVYTIKAASSAADVSSTQALIGKISVVAKSAAKVLKVALAGAEAIASTYETPCTILLISGLTLGYITPIFLVGGGITILLAIVIGPIFLILIAPIVAIISFINFLNGQESILKDFYMRMISYYLQNFIYMPVVLIVMTIYLFSPYKLVRIMIAYGYSNDHNIIDKISVLMMLFALLVTLCMYALKLLPTLINDLSAAMKTNTRVDSSLESHIVQVSTATGISTQLTSTAKMTIGRLAGLNAKNQEENKKAEMNQENIAKSAKKYFDSRTQSQLDIDLKDPQIKKLYEEIQNKENK